MKAGLWISFIIGAVFFILGFVIVSETKDSAVPLIPAIPFFAIGVIYLFVFVVLSFAKLIK